MQSASHSAATGQFCLVRSRSARKCRVSKRFRRHFSLRPSVVIEIGATRYATFLLEYDNERAGGFAPLADVPSDKLVVLGLVSTKNGTLEDPAELARRVDEASRYFAFEQLALSTQCGFASVAAGNPITPEAQSAKLGLVATTARRIWGEARN